MAKDIVPSAEVCRDIMYALTDAENYDLFLLRLQKHYSVSGMNLLIDPELPTELIGYYDPATKTYYTHADCPPSIVLSGFYQHLIMEGKIADEKQAEEFSKSFIGRAEAYRKFQD